MPIQQMMLGSGGSAGITTTYVDEVFNIDLWNGATDAAENIVNGIDFDDKGGFIWHKKRTGTSNLGWHVINDSVRGADKGIYPNVSNSGGVLTSGSSFNNNGFTWASENNFHVNGCEMVSQSFAKQAGFVDVVEYTGNNTARDISHDLGAIPGMILLKASESTADWVVYHKDGGNQGQGILNEQNAWSSGNSTIWDSTTPTSSSFRVGANANTNANGTKYIAYLFAGAESTADTATSVDMNTDGYLSVPASSDYAFGTGDYTIEMWIYYVSATNYTNIFEGRPDSSNGAYTVMPITDDELGVYKSVTGSNDWYITPSSATTLPKGKWTHVAVVREGTGSNQTKMYFDGTQVAQGTDDENYDTSQGIRFGAVHAWNSGDFVGKFSNFRVVKGTAVYTSSFKVPKEPLENITNTKLLCCQGSSVTDATVIATGSITAGSHATNTPQASTDSPFYDTGCFKFGDDQDNLEQIIACGSHTNSVGSTDIKIYLGWEPQWLLAKNASASSDWLLMDTMRGSRVMTGNFGTTDGQYLNINTDGAEGAADTFIPQPDGFIAVTGLTALNPGNGNEIIWMAIRRPDGYVGKPITTNTKSFNVDQASGDGNIPNYDTTFPVDYALVRSPSGSSWYNASRLTRTKYNSADSTTAEDQLANWVWDWMTGWAYGGSTDYFSYMFRRHAYFDVVTYKRSQGDIGIPHSLNGVPEMIWTKRRDSTATSWGVYHFGLDSGNDPENFGLYLNQNVAEQNSANFWNNTAPTATHFTIGDASMTGNANSPYIAVLWRSQTGISKCGYYTGSSSNVAVSTGFQPRIVIVKRVSDAQGWVVVDSLNGDANFFSLHGSDAMQTTRQMTFTGTGFTVESGQPKVNANNDRYVYYAHA